MSQHRASSRLSCSALRAMKGEQPIVMLTAYTAPMARLLDETVDVLLVGDSLGMVMYGMPTTMGVSLDLMIAHGKAVVDASEKACVLVDMPFGSYQASKVHAFEACARVMAETGCSGVKIEGGTEMAETIAYLTARGIPVMGHIGLMPQYYHAIGGFRSQGKTEAERQKILGDAKAIEQAGAFALLMEAVREDIAAEVTKIAAIPTIGIGASVECDGQVLVTEDILGLTPHRPKFAKAYVDLAPVMEQAVKAYADDVRERVFPGPEHVFRKK